MTQIELAAFCKAREQQTICEICRKLLPIKSKAVPEAARIDKSRTLQTANGPQEPITDIRIAFSQDQESLVGPRRSRSHCHHASNSDICGCSPSSIWRHHAERYTTESTRHSGLPRLLSGPLHYHEPLSKLSRYTIMITIGLPLLIVLLKALLIGLLIAL